jgi:hypothetical protein
VKTEGREGERGREREEKFFVVVLGGCLRMYMDTREVANKRHGAIRAIQAHFFFTKMIANITPFSSTAPRTTTGKAMATAAAHAGPSSPSRGTGAEASSSSSEEAEMIDLIQPRHSQGSCTRGKVLHSDSDLEDNEEEKKKKKKKAEKLTEEEEEEEEEEDYCSNMHWTRPYFELTGKKRRSARGQWKPEVNCRVCRGDIEGGKRGNKSSKTALAFFHSGSLTRHMKGHGIHF